MKVMKFGGTSVGSVNSILSVKKIVEAVNEPVIIVVSALGGITDKLINTSRMAASGDAAYDNDWSRMAGFPPVYQDGEKTFQACAGYGSHQ